MDSFGGLGLMLVVGFSILVGLIYAGRAFIKWSFGTEELIKEAKEQTRLMRKMAGEPDVKLKEEAA